MDLEQDTLPISKSPTGLKSIHRLRTVGAGWKAGIGRLHPRAEEDGFLNSNEIREVLVLPGNGIAGDTGPL